MVEAYEFVHIRAGWARKIVLELVDVPEVAVVHACWGQPDVISYVKVSELKKLQDLILQKFHRVEGVESTDTHNVVEV